MIGKTLVIGLGQFGFELARSLSEKGFFVIAVDSDMTLIQQISNHVQRAVELDATDENALASLGIDQIDTAICAIGEKYLETSILATALLHQLGVPTIIARATTPLHNRILRAVGAIETINPEQEMGKRLALKLSLPGLVDMIPLSDDLAVSEITCPSQFQERSLNELKLRNTYGVTVIYLKRHREGKREKSVLVNPKPGDILRGDDILFVVGKTKDIEALSQLH